MGAKGASRSGAALGPGRGSSDAGAGRPSVTLAEEPSSESARHSGAAAPPAAAAAAAAAEASSEEEALRAFAAEHASAASNLTSASSASAASRASVAAISFHLEDLRSQLKSERVRLKEAEATALVDEQRVGAAAARVKALAQTAFAHNAIQPFATLPDALQAKIIDQLLDSR